MTELKEHYNVLICTPGHSMESEYVKSLVETIKILDKEGITWKYLSEYSSSVTGAREATIMGSLFLDAFNDKPVRGEVEYDKIFWIDSDISWYPKDFFKIYQSEKDITSGVYINSQGVPMFTQLEKDINTQAVEMCHYEEKFEVSAVGFGFVCMKSGIFENIKRPWFETVYQEIENEEKTKKIKIPFGEDFSWCHRARFEGYSIYVDPKVKVAHNKKIPLIIQ
jgi:hypothetical protein